jgi:hypothetical protein
MASVKQYAYYIKGNKVALVEKDTAFDNDVNSKDYGPGANRAQWKSPISAVADGIEVQYVYSPDYYIRSTDSVTTVTTQYRINSGILEIADNSVSRTNYNTVYGIVAGNYLVLRNAGKWNGLHKIDSLGDNSGTNNKIITFTKASGALAWTDFEETPSLYYAIETLEDESDTIDLSSYLSKALVYYVKARISEDTMNIDAKEYYMKEFRRMVEKYNNTRISGIRMQASGPYAIR